MPKIQIVVKSLYGKTVQTPCGPILFGPDGCVEVDDTAFATLTAIDGFIDPDNPPAPPAPPTPLTPKEETLPPGANIDAVVDGYIRYNQSEERLTALRNAIDERLEALVPNTLYAPEPEPASTVEEPLADSVDADGEPEALEGNVATVAALVAALEDPATLDLYEEAEKEHGNRTGVLKAIAKRRKELAASAD